MGIIDTKPFTSLINTNRNNRNHSHVSKELIETAYKESEEVLQSLNTTTEGLTLAEAHERLKIMD